MICYNPISQLHWNKVYPIFTVFSINSEQKLLYFQAIRAHDENLIIILAFTGGRFAIWEEDLKFSGLTTNGLSFLHHS